jgi:hypothetical protein
MKAAHYIPALAALMFLATGCGSATTSGSTFAPTAQTAHSKGWTDWAIVFHNGTTQTLKISLTDATCFSAPVTHLNADETTGVDMTRTCSSGSSDANIVVSGKAGQSSLHVARTAGGAETIKRSKQTGYKLDVTSAQEVLITLK